MDDNIETLTKQSLELEEAGISLYEQKCWIGYLMVRRDAKEMAKDMEDEDEPEEYSAKEEFESLIDMCDDDHTEGAEMIRDEFKTIEKYDPEGLKQPILEQEVL